MLTRAPNAFNADLVVAAGDLPVDYLEALINTLDKPGVFVPGNHDLEFGGYRQSRGLWTRAGLPAPWPGPQGWLNVDLRVANVAGLRIAGLGGSIRYRNGPNQWTQRQQAKRARRLIKHARRLNKRHAARQSGQPLVDLLLTHSPPAGVGDLPDPAHRGFTSLHEVVAALQPRVLVHGHIHPYGQPRLDKWLDHTQIVNAVGYRLLDIPQPEAVDYAP